eukprot:TRINITY_DN26497_c0_g1_i1.p1 TRINITY_DN26497_c0_g1~~TRINITY_DN26497_c0_g1_i1.p1  ORF type:complete len:471 (+),score=88.49 TRINITY_DN26497_c0_g1_i1:68-1414(+)
MFGPAPDEPGASPRPRGRRRVCGAPDADPARGIVPAVDLAPSTEQRANRGRSPSPRPQHAAGLQSAALNRGFGERRARSASADMAALRRCSVGGTARFSMADTLPTELALGHSELFGNRRRVLRASQGPQDCLGRAASPRVHDAAAEYAHHVRRFLYRGPSYGWGAAETAASQRRDAQLREELAAAGGPQVPPPPFGTSGCSAPASPRRGRRMSCTPLQRHSTWGTPARGGDSASDISGTYDLLAYDGLTTPHRRSGNLSSRRARRESAPWDKLAPAPADGKGRGRGIRLSSPSPCGPRGRRQPGSVGRERQSGALSGAAASPRASESMPCGKRRFAPSASAKLQKHWDLNTTTDSPPRVPFDTREGEHRGGAPTPPRGNVCVLGSPGRPPSARRVLDDVDPLRRRDIPRRGVSPSPRRLTPARRGLRRVRSPRKNQPAPLPLSMFTN